MLYGRSSAHEQALLSKDTIDSFLQHKEVGRAKDLPAPPLTGENQEVTEYKKMLIGDSNRIVRNISNCI